MAHTPSTPRGLDSRETWELTRRRLLQHAAAATGVWTASQLGVVFGQAAQNPAQDAQGSQPAGPKVVYISFMLHGNMCYDRYTKQEIRDKFPRIYATGVRAMRDNPEVTAHIDFPGLTVLSLKHHAPWFLDELRPLIERKQVVMVGCQYAASHALCSDEESDLVSDRVTMDILRRELQADTNTFFPQEMIFHPQMPYIMNQIGAQRLVVWPRGWQRPRRVRGIDGSEVVVYPHDGQVVQPGKLEAFYDSHPSGSFVMGGGDFEQLGNVRAYINEIRRLAEKGKIIRWTTVDRYEQEVGIQETCEAPHPFRGTAEDLEENPSFSRWVGRPDDMIWHGHAVGAMDAIRTAGFAKVAAATHKLAAVDVPLTQSLTAPPDNPWDSFFEEVSEYPETELQCLAGGGEPTVLSRAWHHLLIGLNSDSSGWFPWTPRTRHRNGVLESSRGLSREVITRFAQQIAARLGTPKPAGSRYVLAINPTPARTVEVSMEVDSPLALVPVEGSPTPGAVTLRDGRWITTARVELPSYGYRLLGLAPTDKVTQDAWSQGSKVSLAGRQASLADGQLTLAAGSNQVQVGVAPFKLHDPTDKARTEQITPDWKTAVTRVRQTVFGPDLEVMTELGWALWLRLVIGLREDRFQVTAEVHVDLPRRVGNLRYDPNGLLLTFRGQPGRVFYDVPYATIEHTNPEPSFVAAQRFVALEAGAASFALIALGGNQSFQLAAKQGILAANLGASIQGRADTRPECIIRPDGYADHKITSGGDPFTGSYEHRFALLFGQPAAVARAARVLRTETPLVAVVPGNGDWPTQQTLLPVEPAEAYVTAFRTKGTEATIVVNELSGEPLSVRCGQQNASLPKYGIAELRL